MPSRSAPSLGATDERSGGFEGAWATPGGRLADASPVAYDAPSMADATLLERGDLQEAMERALRESRHGGGQVLLIEGAAGIGKSRLLAELRASTNASQRVLIARASELERGFAFGVVRQLFEGIVRDPQQREQALEGAASASLEIFEDLETAGGAASFALLHGLYWLTMNIAEQGPLVLCVDDLHWCDTSSLRFLAYLARRLEGTDILLATATRPIAPDSADAQLLGDLLEQPNVVHLFPQALSAEATRASSRSSWRRRSTRASRAPASTPPTAIR